MKCEGELINMTRARDKEKFCIPDRNRQGTQNFSLSHARVMLINSPSHLSWPYLHLRKDNININLYHCTLHTKHDYNKIKCSFNTVLTKLSGVTTDSFFFCMAESVLGYLLTGLAFDDNLLGNCNIKNL